MLVPSEPFECHWRRQHGEPVYSIANTLPPENRKRLVIHIQGGSYVLNPRGAAGPEAIVMAGFADNSQSDFWNA